MILQLVIRDKPEFAPSIVAAAPRSEESFRDSFKEMWANKNFMTLSLAYALIYGVTCAVAFLISNLFNPFGFSPAEISIIGGTALLAGIVAALVFGCFLDHTTLYRKTHIAISFMSLMSFIIMEIALLSSQATLNNIMVSTLLFGISCVSYGPTSLSYGAELTFPLQPVLVSAFMNFLG